MTLDEAFEIAARAADEQRGNYFWEPIPTGLDTPLYGLVAAFAEAETRSRGRLVEQLTRRQRIYLTSFGVRLASMAVRELDPELIVLGLVALGLGWPGVGDLRESMMDLAPVYQAAMKLEAIPADLFGRAARIVGDDDFSRFLRAWLRRSERDKSLKVMGYREVTDADGFRFVPGREPDRP